MSEKMYRDRVARLYGAKASLERKRGDVLSKAAKLEEEALRAESSVTPSTSESTARQRLRQAATRRKQASDERRSAARLDGDIARKVKEIGDAEEALERELNRTRKKHEEAERKRRREEDKRAKDRETERRKEDERDRKRREVEKRHVRELAREAEWAARQRAPTIQYIERPLPSKARVLFIAASPEDQQQLRIDQEVRDIQEKIRASKHRESLELHWRPAARTTDLLQALNEVQPHVVHFSGHGDQDFLVFEDHEGNSKPLTNDVLASLLHATSDNIRVILFNSCSSSAQAELAIDAIDLAIGMGVTISDESAKVFAANFYSAIGFGRSVMSAFDQAKVAIDLADLDEASTPQLFAAEGVDPDDVVLIRAP